MRIRHRPICATSAIYLPDVIPSHNVKGGQSSTRNQRSQKIGAFRIEHLVSIEHKNPVAGRLPQDQVAGFRKITVPRDRHPLCSKCLGNFGCIVCRPRISDDDAIDDGTNAPQTSLETASSIFHNHREFDRGCTHPLEPLQERLSPKEGTLSVGAFRFA